MKGPETMYAMNAIRRCLHDEGGATAIEYSLIAGIVMTCLLAIMGTGGALEAIYDTMQKIADAMS